MESLTIQHMIEGNCSNSTIPLPNVSSKALSKLIEYSKKHVEAANKTKDLASSSTDSSDDKLKAWDAELVKLDSSTLTELMRAANYLNIQDLLDLTCQRVANMIEGKTPEEIRELLNIDNDFTPEEEEEIRRENKWAFE